MADCFLFFVHRSFTLAWLRGTRKNPPTLDETIAQEAKREHLAEKVKIKMSKNCLDSSRFLASEYVTNKLRSRFATRWNK